MGKLPAEFVYGLACQSPEIVHYDACYVDQGCFAMVMEFPEGYSVLRDHVIGHGPLDMSSLQKVRLTLVYIQRLSTHDFTFLYTFGEFLHFILQPCRKSDNIN